MKHDLIEHRNLTLMLTYRCNAQCAECGTFSSPHDKNDITLETALKAIDWAKDIELEQVVFTGGEPSLRWDDLLTCIRYAKTKGMVTRVVTNGQWATSKETADTRIRELMDAGLDEINYSTGDEHVRFIPLEHVLHAVQAAISAGMNSALMFELRAKSRIDEKDLLEKLDAMTPGEGTNGKFTFIRSPWMPIRPDNIAEYPPGIYANKQNVTQRTGCDSVLSNYVVQGSGKIAPCCGLGMRTVPELQIGDAVKHELNDKNPLATAIKEAESDLFLYALRKIGPEKIVAWAATKDPSIQWENMYAHRCQACMRIYRDPKVKQVIIDNIQELMAEMVYGGMVLKQFEKLAEKSLTETSDQSITHFV